MATLEDIVRETLEDLASEAGGMSDIKSLERAALLAFQAARKTES